MRKINLILFVIISLLLISCTQFNEDFNKCVAEKSNECFTESNCKVGVSIDELKSECCYEFNMTPYMSSNGKYISCISIS